MIWLFEIDDFGTKPMRCFKKFSRVARDLLYGGAGDFTPRLIYLTRRTAQSQFWHVDLLYGGATYGGVTGGLSHA